MTSIRRTRIRFGLKALIAMTAISGLLASVYARMRSFELERANALTRIDDLVTWDVYDLRDEASNLPWSRWLSMKIAGGSLRSSVICAEFRKSSTLEDVRLFIRLFPELQTLAFDRSVFNGEQLEVIKDAPMLQEIVINGGGIDPIVAKRTQMLPQRPVLRFEEQKYNQAYVTELAACGVDIDAILWAGQPVEFFKDGG